MKRMKITITYSKLVSETAKRKKVNEKMNGLLLV